MELTLLGDLQGLEQAILAVAPDLDINIGDAGRKVIVRQSTRDAIDVTWDAGIPTIHHGSRVQFFRALGLVVEAMSVESQKDVTEEPHFSLIGPMIDVSQGNAVLRVETVKGLIRKMALMGLNMLMLYAEDSYVVPDQPYFGYMRGKYTAADIRECDAYAAMFGIELIPCIQTLGHLPDALRWKSFEDVKDDATTLLVGADRTYEFIEQMIVAASEPVRTRRIHIGMDEAWNLGLGAYLAEHGFRPKSELMQEHLARVMEIVRKHGLQPMIWSDMFFRALSRTNRYHDDDVQIPPEILQSIPGDLQLIYWAYTGTDPEFYRRWIRKHKLFGHTPVFAGGIWNWASWGLNYGQTFAATDAALIACKEEGVTEVIATTWGDDGTECDITAALLGMQLFAEHCYGDGADRERLAQRFRTCTKARYDDFIALSYLDEVPGVSEGNHERVNPSRYVLWQPVLHGLFDAHIAGRHLDRHYQKLAERMGEAVAGSPDYSAMFEVYEKLCQALAAKAEIGLRLTAAYRDRDREQLQMLAETDLPQVARRVEELRLRHRRRWHEIYQPFGWEVIDGRYGNVLLGIDAAIWRVTEYLSGRVSRIEELEEPRLDFAGKPGIIYSKYVGPMQSGSRLVWYDG
jgi:hexosaminidase